MMFIRRKAISTILLTVVLVIVFMLFTATANKLIFADKIRSRDVKKLEAINSVLEDLSSSISDAERKAVDLYEVNAVLTAAALDRVISDRKDYTVEAYSSGAVVRIENGRITAPGDIRRDLGLAASLFKEEKGIFAAPADASTLIAYSRIGESPYYFLEWYEDTDLTELVNKTVNPDGILEEAEAAYGSGILLVRKDASAGSGMTVLYRSKNLSKENGLDEMGLTAEEIEQSVGKPPKDLMLDGGNYKYSVGEIPSLNGYAILLIPETDIVQQTMDQIGGLVSILILILSGMATTGLSLYGYALRNAGKAGMRKRYRPAFMRKLIVLCGFTGLLFMGISSVYLYSLNGLHEAAMNGRDALGMLQKRIAMNISRDSSGVRSTIDSYIDYGNHISEIIDRYPQLRDRETLEELAERIGASSITLYDCTGKETVSSNGYIDMSLGTGVESTTYDFRRILKGVPYIVHEAETDETTGLTEVRIGIRTGDPSSPGKYGVMLLSLDPALVGQATAEEIGNTLRYMSEEETMLWIAESGSGTILASSDGALTGRDIYSIGMGENDLTEGLMKGVYLENGQYFVISSLLDDPVIAKGAERFDRSIAYYAVSRRATNHGVLYTVANCCILFAAIYSLLAWFIFRDYTDEFYEACKNRGASVPEETGNTASGDENAVTVRSLWEYLFGPESYWGSLRPEQKGLIVIEIFLALFLFQQIPLLLGKGSQDSLYYYILKSLWERGVNLFAIARVLILAGEMILTVIILNCILRIIGRQTGAKGWTVCRLIMNVIRYLSLASFVGLSLYYLGIDKTTLLAALSILSLAISLGSQSLIADIIAGISIILEGVFDVDDIVVIGQNTGKVMEIGVRTTRILCPGNDVLVIGNKEIQSVINKSKKSTVFHIPIRIRSDYPVDVIRELLERELPEIGAKNGMILHGPEFEGITEIEDGRMTLAIETECRQADAHKVKVYLNSELQKLFAKNGIRI